MTAAAPDVPPVPAWTPEIAVPSTSPRSPEPASEPSRARQAPALAVPWMTVATAGIEASPVPCEDVTVSSTSRSAATPVWTAWKGEAWARDLAQRLGSLEAISAPSGVVSAGKLASTGLLSQIARGVLRR
jgi:hypothetical protein